MSPRVGRGVGKGGRPPQCPSRLKGKQGLLREMTRMMAGRFSRMTSRTNAKETASWKGSRGRVG